MKAKIILVALALFLGAIGYTVQAQCSADCQCGKTTEDKTLAVGNRKVADFSMIRLEAVGDIFFTQSDRCSVLDRGAARIRIQNYYSCEKWCFSDRISKKQQ